MTVRETILCVDDEEGVLHALRQQLGARFGHECEIATASSGHDALELLDELERDGERIAVVIADQIMPGMKGVDLLELVDRRSPSTTKILLTGQAGLDAVVSAINRANLNHYLAKPWDEASLRLAVENLLRQYRLTAENRELIATLSAKNQALLEMNRELEAKIHERTHELAEANARLAQLAVTDGLTGLYNHRHFHERLALEVERSARNGLPLSLLMIDVDHFKHYNDHHGHPAGDEVLRQMARLLAEGRRANDLVARYGGEEFGLVLVDTAKFTAAKLAERIRDRVASHGFVNADAQPGGTMSISVGVASFPDDASDAEALIQAADDALYAAKRAGRDRVVLAASAAIDPGSG
ncbi:MAG: diguanylate cyclase [Kofleriaceae bacterium]|nr:diguanylate cyclase [Kofleriaceae bacterium]MBP9165884.1 diguanylate cyclase [Kofleriaceae bacterium]MBP9857543.1 diguanylate cyclase [Kofleriaceae bacterium]